MPPRRRSAGFLPMAVFAGVGLLCCLGAVVAVEVSVPSLGKPARGLPWPDQMFMAMYLLLNQRDLSSPAGTLDRMVTIDVEPGQDASDVAAALANLGVLQNPTLFKRYLRYRGLDTGIEAGSYEVSGSMSPRDLAELLQRARASRYTVTVPEGWRKEEVADALGRLGLGFSSDEFLAASRTTLPLDMGARSGSAGVEGFLFPDTYQLGPGVTADEVVRTMVENFEARVGSEWLAAVRAKGLTPYEAVSLASIVERESALPAERPLIASVFFNRLALGIPLQADPTVQYALGRQADGAWWKAPLTEVDLSIDSPYNTYLYPGLPPGPIGNPGLTSLESVAHPAESAFLFFRAACDGSGRHVFAATFEEHVRNACP